MASFRKGQLVRISGIVQGHRTGITGWRQPTADELDRWRNQLPTPFDSAGESWLPPERTGIHIPNDHVLVVLRGRVSGKSLGLNGAHHILVQDPILGEDLVVWGGAVVPVCAEGTGQ